MKTVSGVLSAAKRKRSHEMNNTRKEASFRTTGLITETRMWSQRGSKAAAGTWRRNEERRRDELRAGRPFQSRSPRFEKSRSSFIKTEAVHPSVRLPLIPFHLTDSPGVTVKTRSRDNLCHSMTSQTLLLRLKGTYKAAVPR